jgi:hypothetical protein
MASALQQQQLTPTARCAYLVMSDLCTLSRGESGRWYVCYIYYIPAMNIYEHSNACQTSSTCCSAHEYYVLYLMQSVSAAHAVCATVGAVCSHILLA